MDDGFKSQLVGENAPVIDHFPKTIYLLTIYCMSAYLDAVGLVTSLVLCTCLSGYALYLLSKTIYAICRWIFRERYVWVCAVEIEVYERCVIIRSRDGQLLDVIRL